MAVERATLAIVQRLHGRPRRQRREELLFNPGAYSLQGGARLTVEFPEAFKAPNYDQHYNMRMVAAGDLTNAQGAEIVLLEGCEIRLLDCRGQTLGAAAAPFGFTDVIYVPGSPRGHVLLGSSPNGDDNVYRLRFDAGWEDAIAGLTRRGFMAGVEDDLDELASAIGSWNGTPLDEAAKPYDIVIDHHMWSGPDLAKLDISPSHSVALRPDTRYALTGRVKTERRAYVQVISGRHPFLFCYSANGSNTNSRTAATLLSSFSASSSIVPWEVGRICSMNNPSDATGTSRPLIRTFVPGSAQP